MQKKIVLTSAIAILIGLVVSLSENNQTFAQETEEKKYTSANDISIYTVFSFREAVEESEGFQVYKQISGFDRRSEQPVFKLEGVVDSNRVHLYEAADMAYNSISQNSQQKYGYFEVDIYLNTEGETLRHFSYTDCMIIDYTVNTLFDKEEGWTTSKGFAIIDEFEFECNGYKPNNPLYELMTSNKDESNTKSSIDYQKEQRN